MAKPSVDCFSLDGPARPRRCRTRTTQLSGIAPVWGSSETRPRAGGVILCSPRARDDAPGMDCSAAAYQCVKPACATIVPSCRECSLCELTTSFAHDDANEIGGVL